jgi:hypothetical protein
MYARSAPFRGPFHFGDFRQRARTDRRDNGTRFIQIDKPLLSGPKNHRVMTAPAMWITVRKFLFAEQCATIPQQFQHNRIRLENRLTFVLRQAFQIAAFVIDGCVRLDSIFLSCLKVLDAVTRCGMHDTRTLIQRDVIGQHRRHLQIQEWMPKIQIGEIFAFPWPTNLFRLQLQCIQSRPDQILRQKQRSRIRLRDNIFVVRMKRERAIVRQRPRCRGPDHRTYPGAKFLRRRPRRHRELYPDRGTGVVLIFDFGLG